jgi:hypothetical protein
MLKGWPVRFGQNVATYLDHVLWRDSYHQRIEGTVMNCAHRDPIGDNRLSTFRVLPDVSRVEQLRVTKAAQSTLSVVGGQDPPPEVRLMDPPSHGGKRVFSPSNFIGSCEEYLRLPRGIHCLIEGYDELMFLRLLRDKPNGIHGFVEPRCHAHEPGEWPSLLHRDPEGHIVGEARIHPTPLVAGIAIGSDVILVWPVFRAIAVGGEDR